MTTTAPTAPLAKELDEVVNGTSSSMGMTLQVGTVTIEFKFKKKSDADLHSVVAYTTQLDNAEIPVGDAIALISEDIAKLLPDTIKKQKIKFEQLIAIYSKEKNNTKWLFLLDLALSDPFAFADLPLIGDAFQNTPIGEITFLPSLRIIAASKSFTLKETRYYNENLLTDDDDEEDDDDDEEEEEGGFEKLPDPGKGKGQDTDTMIRKGVSLSGKLEIDNFDYFFNLPVSPEEEGEAIAEAPDNDSAAVGKYGLWFDIDKSIAVVTLKKIGLVYDSKENKLAILFDAAIAVGPFTLSCDKMGVELAFGDSFKAKFTIDGAGIEYKTDSIEIAGALLYKEKELNNISYKEFIGLAVVKFKLSGKGSDGGKSFGISAIGSYAHYDGKPALFFYAVLDYPLGGPGFCFVTGLAFGLGYNRFLKVPEIEGLSDFPLVAQAVGGGTDKKVTDISKLITQQLEDLDNYVTLSPGSGFIAMGLKFTSYKLVDCFALLTVAIGEDFEINLLGIASMRIPPAIPGGKKVQPLAELTMLLRARFSLNEMVLSVEAQISKESYILSKNCFLTGGFAFYIWFGGPHAGDFVITLGGYHPEFKKPAHYPNVPRLGFLWKVDSSLYLKGEIYFALCSHALMAGGKLEASFRAGSLWAYFIAEAHFLISWKPYYYDILIRVRIEAAVGCVGPVCLGIKLHIWGPEFGGTATFKIIFVSVTMNFGDHTSRYPTPIDWADFRESFLPSNSEVCTAVITDGITRQLWQDDGSPLFIVNSEEFELVTDSVIPTKKAFYYDTKSPLPTDHTNRTFGVPSMGICDRNLTTTHTIEIFRGQGDNKKLVEAKEWKFEPITKKIPTALWGEARVTTKGSKEYLLPPETNEELFLDNTLCGFRITPGKPSAAGNTTDVPVKNLQHDTQHINNAYAWRPIPTFGAMAGLDDVRRKAIKDNIVSSSTTQKRNSLLRSLGFDPTEEVQLTNSVADDFVIAPRVK